MGGEVRLKAGWRREKKKREGKVGDERFVSWRVEVKKQREQDTDHLLHLVLDFFIVQWARVRHSLGVCRGRKGMGGKGGMRFGAKVVLERDSKVKGRKESKGWRRSIRIFASSFSRTGLLEVWLIYPLRIH